MVETSTKMFSLHIRLLLPLSLHCEPCLIVSPSVSSCLFRSESPWKSWMIKTRWGFPASLFRGELMRRHYGFLFVLVAPTLYEEEAAGRRACRWRGTHGRDRATGTGGLIHNSIIIENLPRRLCASLVQNRSLWMRCESRAQKNSLFPSVAEV